MSREKHRAVKYWTIIVALVSIISNLIFISSFSIQSLLELTVFFLVLVFLAALVFFLRVLIIPILLFNRLQSLQSIQPK